MSESESEQERRPEESTEMDEKPAGFRAMQPPVPSDVEIAQDADERTREGAGADVNVSEDVGDEADAVTNAPDAAKPGAKEDPDMKDMAVGSRPIDDQSRK